MTHLGGGTARTGTPSGVGRIRDVGRLNYGTFQVLVDGTGVFVEGSCENGEEPPDRTTLFSHRLVSPSQGDG